MKRISGGRMKMRHRSRCSIRKRRRWTGCSRAPRGAGWGRCGSLDSWPRQATSLPTSSSRTRFSTMTPRPPRCSLLESALASCLHLLLLAISLHLLLPLPQCLLHLLSSVCRRLLHHLQLEELGEEESHYWHFHQVLHRPPRCPRS